MLAATPEMLKAYRGREIGWDAYAKKFLALMRSRKVEAQLSRALFDGACLLCTEAKPHHCRRRPIGEYLDDRWKGPPDVVHL